MILAIDIGNTDITIGLSNRNEWVHVWRIPVKQDKDLELVFGLRIRDFFLDAGLRTVDIEKIMISSVVPQVTTKISSVSMSVFGRSPTVLNGDIYSSLPLKVLNPYEIGSDLVANALAAFVKYEGRCIIVDFGTALTFTAVAADGEILGVAILPGLKTAIRSLSQNAAKLFDVPLEMPQSVLGKNTVHAIQAGILIGYEGLVTQMIARMKNELNDDQCPVVATGGLSSIINSLRNQFSAIEPNLTLDGLRIAATLIN